jgi:hypothetical protein
MHHISQGVASAPDRNAFAPPVQRGACRVCRHLALSTLGASRRLQPLSCVCVHPCESAVAAWWMPLHGAQSVQPPAGVAWFSAAAPDQPVFFLPPGPPGLDRAWRPVQHWLYFAVTLLDILQAELFTRLRVVMRHITINAGRRDRLVSWMVCRLVSDPCRRPSRNAPATALPPRVAVLAVPRAQARTAASAVPTDDGAAWESID